MLKALDRALDNSPYYSSMEDYVTTLTLEGNEKEIRTKSGSVIKAEKVVLCSGVGIREILEASNININVPVLLPGKGVSLVVETNYNSEHVIRTPNRDFACGTHVVPRGNGKLYVGATNRIFNTPGVTDGATTGEINSLLHSVLHEINSDLRTNNLTDIKFGSRPISIDRFPLLGETNINGIYVATGTYRNGILMAPLIANIVSDTILSKKTSYFNPFTLEGRIKPSTDQIITNLIDNGVKDLVSFIQEPTGSLPFNRQNELSNFINALLKMVLINDDEQKALISELQDLTQKYPMSEIIPQIYYNLQVK
ncbi:FAD-dependent oxidoreductase [Bacillus cereus]